MKLRKWHKLVLKHRLECDGQIDVFADTNEIPYSDADEIVRESQDKLIKMVDRFELSLDDLSHVDIEVLIDAVEGSTYLSGAESDCEHGILSKAQLTAIETAIEELEEFVENV